MQFLKIEDTTTLKQLSAVVGSRNVGHVLADNQLDRTPKIGQQLRDKCNNIVNPSSGSRPAVGWQRKSTILNTFTQDSDIYEYACLQSENSWKVLDSLGTFPQMLKMPETIVLPSSNDTLGNREPVRSHIYDKVGAMLREEPHQIDPSVFNHYSTIKPSQLLSGTQSSNNVFQWFHLPWGEITLYSSISKDSVDFPVYPEGLDDNTVANYTTMPDLLYQFEPWQIYTGSGPRSNSYVFDFHRDMWTGDHRDGKANELIRFCQANCYPEYNGSAVDVPTVTLYVAGQPLISGILTGAPVEWDGPIGLDGWYLHCKLTLQITEVAQQPLNYTTVRNKSLIG